MDELRLSLLVLGTCFILAVLAHGIWKIRKGSSKKSVRRERIEPGSWQNESNRADSEEDTFTDTEAKETYGHQPDYDDLGVGKVRVVATSTTETAVKDQSQSDSEVDQSESSDSDNAQEEKADKLYGSVVSNPKPHLKSAHNSPSQTDSTENANTIPEPPGFLMKDPQTEGGLHPDTDEFSLDPPVTPAQHKESTDTQSAATQDLSRGQNRKRSASRTRQEPNFGDDQMRIDFEDNQEQIEASSGQSSSGEGLNQEVLVINVRTAEDAPISGAALLPLLLTLGFKFGDQDIFHRHVNSNGKGPVLFSLANMFKPGVFDIDNLETFSTQGVSLFMILPIEGDAHQVFNMMHNAARKIAEEFSGQVLDGRRSILTKQGLQQYKEKIRDFERKRMISRH